MLLYICVGFQLLFLGSICSREKKDIKKEGKNGGNVPYPILPNVAKMRDGTIHQPYEDQDNRQSENVPAPHYPLNGVGKLLIHQVNRRISNSALVMPVITHLRLFL